MLKLLFIPTGNVFALADAEAIRIYNSDKSNYKILDGGLQEEIFEVLPEKTVSEMVFAEETVEEIPPAPEPKPEPEPEPVPVVDVDVDSMSYRQMQEVGKRFNIDPRQKKEQLAILLKEALGQI